MEIGNQIKQLRQRRGITQEAMAQHFGITPQAVSKWERGAATPDIGMLPAISAYFGVTIDELFALSDDTRMERIQSMIWDVRYFDPADVEKERIFLLEKARREPENDKVYELLVEIENHLAKEHCDRAAQYAKEGLSRNPANRSIHADLVEAMGGRLSDWYVSNYHDLIGFYKEFVEENPTVSCGYMWLMDHLIYANRLDEAEIYLDRFCKVDNTYRNLMYQGMIFWYRGDRERAFSCWDRMEAEFPGEWHVYHYMGDTLARLGRYEEAKNRYRQALSSQNAPSYCDALESIIQVCEIQGKYQEAIDVSYEELDVLNREWHITTGETVDVVRRNIARLKKKL